MSNSGLRSLFSPLDRKLVRDLKRMKGQVAAIALVVGVGVLLLVMMDGLVNSLSETKRAYYERYRLADIFAPLERAPKHVLNDLAALPGVSAVQGRIVGNALIDMADIAVPVRARVLSLPDSGKPRLNGVYLSAGRTIAPGRADEVLVLEAFAKAHNLGPGDRISAIMHGARRSFQIAGVAQAPEFIYTTPPGELMPDDARFAVLWMGQTALAAAYDLTGAVNEILLSINRDTAHSAVIHAVDRILDAYGGLGAYALSEHISDRFMQEEIDGLRVSRQVVPTVFLAVAAFLLYIVISRMVQSEREQIGLLKAFGYASVEIGAHYFKFVMFVALIGAVLGCAAGVLAGRSMIDVFLLYYKFPFLVFQVDITAFVMGVAVSIVTACAGGFFVLRQIFSLTPAVAMQPPAPADYSRGATFAVWIKALLDQPSRMIVRRLVRQPFRAAAAVLGIAAGMALSLAMLGVMSGFETTLALQFNVINRSDAAITFIDPLSDSSLHDVKHLSGVLVVEPFRSVPVIFRNGCHSYRGAIEGLIAQPTLHRALDDKQQPIYLPREGVILAQPLADILHIKAGEMLRVEVREGRRPNLTIPVAGLARTLLGSPAYMELDALNRALKEPGRINGAFLKIDAGHAEMLYQAIKDMPALAGVSLKDAARRAFRQMMDSGAGAVRYVMAAIAGVITFGIVFNSARIAFAERARDLASLRVIGFTKAETAYVLLGELAVVILLALPLGGLIGIGLTEAIAEGFSTDLYQVPATVSADNFGFAALTVLSAAFLSGWLVKRDIDRIDLVSALKTRE